MDEEHSRGMSMLDIADESNLDHHSIHDHDDARQAIENCNLIVNYLPHDIDDLALKGLFVEFGEIVSAKVVTDRNTKKSLGYGFVKFLCEDDAKLAIQRLNGFTIDNKTLKVSVARPASLEIRNCKLYVTNLPKDYIETDVIHLFQEFGDIIECRVLRDKNSRTNKGVAFVQFDNKTQANNALSLNGCQLEGGQRGLVVKYAEDQHKKREMDRLQNLTTHNVYRYLPVAPGGASGSGEDMGVGMGGFRPQDPSDTSPGYYYSSSLSGSGSGSVQGMSPHYPSAALQVPLHGHGHGHGQQSPHLPQRHLQSPAQPPPPPHPSPVQQHHHSVHTHQGLGGINAIFNGASPLQMSVPMQAPTGMVPVSPIMGAVSPNHFYYQQQQLLQQQMGVNMSGSTSPRMFVYSPTAGMRRAIKGRGMGAGGDPGGGGGVSKQYPTVDISLLTSDQPPSPLPVHQQHQQQHHHQQQQQQQFHYQNPPPQQHAQQGGYGGGYYGGQQQHQQGRAVPGAADFGMMNVANNQQQARQHPPPQQNAPHPQHAQHAQYQNAMSRSPVMHSASMRMPSGMMQPAQQQHNYPPPVHAQQQAQQLSQLGMHQLPQSPPAQYAQSPPVQYASLPPQQYQQQQGGGYPQLVGKPSHQIQGQGQGQSHMEHSAGPGQQHPGHQAPYTTSSSPPQRHKELTCAPNGGQNHNGVAGVTLLVSNLPPHADVAMLHEMFAPFRLLSADFDDIDSTTNNIHTTTQTNTNTTMNTTTNTTNSNTNTTSSDSVTSHLARARVQVAGMHQAESAVQAVHNCCFHSDVPVQVSIASSNFE